LKCIQIAVVSTYFLSALTKIRSGGWSITSWPESSILLWAIVRRPHGLGQFFLPYPELLHLMQWFSFTAELTAVVVLWLHGRALLAAAVFWMGFHVFTLAILYIHFAPTAVCWLAFAPLERFGPWLRRRARWVKARRRERTGRRSARHAVPVLPDQAVDGGG
jgi:small-conductance mechanosensitive channel